MALKNKKSKGVKKGSVRGPYKKNKVTPTSKKESEVISTEILKENSEELSINKPESVPVEINKNESKEVNPETKIKEAENETEKETETNKEEAVKLPETKQTDVDVNSDKVLEEYFKDFKDVSEQQKSDAERAAKERDSQNNSKSTEFENTEDLKVKRKYTKRSTTEERTDEVSDIFNGTILITFCDLIFPGIIKFIFKKISKNKLASKVKTEKTILTEEQVTSLGDVSDAAAKEIFKYFHPLVIFALSLSTMYFMNFKMELAEVEKLEKAKEKEKLKEESEVKNVK